MKIPKFPKFLFSHTLGARVQGCKGVIFQVESTLFTNPWQHQTEWFVMRYRTRSMGFGVACCRGSGRDGTASGNSTTNNGAFPIRHEDNRLMSLLVLRSRSITASSTHFLSMPPGHVFSQRQRSHTSNHGRAELLKRLSNSMFHHTLCVLKHAF